MNLHVIFTKGMYIGYSLNLPHKKHVLVCWKFNPQCYSVARWGIIGGGHKWMNVDCKRFNGCKFDWAVFSHLLAFCHRGDAARKSSPDVSHSNLDFLASRLVKNKSMFFISYPVSGIVIATQTA
jgi:hypothetical protein